MSLRCQHIAESNEQHQYLANKENKLENNIAEAQKTYETIAEKNKDLQTESEQLVRTLESLKDESERFEKIHVFTLIKKDEEALLSSPEFSPVLDSIEAFRRKFKDSDDLFFEFIINDLKD